MYIFSDIILFQISSYLDRRNIIEMVRNSTLSVSFSSIGILVPPPGSASDVLTSLAKSHVTIGIWTGWFSIVATFSITDPGGFLVSVAGVLWVKLVCLMSGDSGGTTRGRGCFRMPRRARALAAKYIRMYTKTMIQDGM